MVSKIWSFLKKSWEYIALALGVLAAYLIYMDPSRVEDFDFRDGKLEGKSEAEKKTRERAHEDKKKAKEKLDELKEEEKELEEKLAKTPQHEDKSKEELKRWLRKNYGS